MVRRRSHTITALACGVIALSIGTAAGMMFRPRATLPPLRTTSATLPSTPAPTAPTLETPPKSEVPIIDVAKLPHTTQGAVVGSPGHRLWVDGSLAADWQTPVSCGTHVVQVGSAGTPRTVDVPCGVSVSVSP